jgi:Asp/Glu/hydantoin racemase
VLRNPGVAEARTLLKIPVVGPTEAAMTLAFGYG